MAERVLNDPLSGEEIIQAICDRVSDSLRKDCYLSPNMAYDYFTAVVKIEVRAHDVGRDVEIKTADVVTAGVENEDMHLEASDADFVIEAAPPNEVRVESGQPVPVLTKDAEGEPTIKKIKYGRKK